MKTSLRSKLWLAALLLLLPFAGRAAEVAAGKVFQIVNDQYGLAVTSNGPDGGVTCTGPDATKFAQLWIAEDGDSRYSYYFRNLATGRYLTSSDRQSAQWSVGQAKSAQANLRLFKKEIGNNTVYTIRPNDSNWDRAYMHCDGSRNVVCWDASAATSQWLFNEVEVSEDEINGATSKTEEMNNIIANASKYAETLGRIFSDGACTKLAGTPSEADLASLPEALRQMVKKVQTGDWSETNNNDASIKWDSRHALRFRARDYNVFSRGSEITALTGTSAGTNMSNPTGIMANAYDVLYIMVDSEPADDATLYFRIFSHNGMENDWTSDIQLHKGLNVVPVWGDGNMAWVYYTAKTWEGDRNGKPAHKLSEFPPIKIHIEGGVINSYWDTQIDNEEDWFYYRDRAQHPMYDILSNYCHIRFFLDMHGWGDTDEPTSPGIRQNLAPGSNRSILRTAESWDAVYLGEHLAMGTMSDEEIDRYGKGYYNHNADDKIAPRVNFREYFNNRHMGIESQNVKNPNGGYWRSCYPAGDQNGMLDVIDGDIWCLHHEAGHTFQGPINLVGQTEMSNNGLANIATIYSSNRTTRSQYVRWAAENFNNGGIFQENDLWSCARMYYQLWLYYHAAGYNKNFFPRLYELLRRDPIIHHPVWEPVPTRQIEDGLHFAKMACIAAQEDLTEFFEGWGFLTTCDNFLVGDYTNHYLTLTQAEADNWRKEIAAMGFPKNITPLFIDERPGQTERVSYPEERFCIENAGDLGGLVHFQAKTRVTKPYTYTLSGNNVTMEGGEGGIGFVVRDGDGKLLAFSNDYSFKVNPATASRLLASEAHIFALGEGRDTEPVRCESTMSTATPEKRAELLTELVKSANVYVDDIDDDGLIVGKIKASSASELRTLRNEANDILSNGEAAKYEDIFNRLSAEYYTVDADKNNRIKFIPGSTYHLTLRGNDGRYEGSLSGGRRSLTNAPADLGSTMQQWVFETVDDSHFALKNVSSSQYLGTTMTDDNVTGYKMSPSPVSFSFGVISGQPSDFCIMPNDKWNWSLNWNPNQNKFIPASGDWGNSQFRLTLVEANPLGKARQDMDDIISETAALQDKAGKVDDTPRGIPVPLGQEDSYYFSNAKCKSTQYGDQFTGFNVLNDTTSSTFFHSDYSGEDSDDGLDHYIGIDLAGGDDNVKMTVSKFHIIYTTRGSGNPCAPTHILVQGSADGSEWFDIAEITEGLPTANDTEYVSDVLVSPQPARFVRMMVKETSTGQTAGGHKYFVVSEFGIANANFTAIPSDAYPSVTSDLLVDVYDALKSARKVRENSADADEINASADELREQYYRLAAAMGVPTGIETIIPGDSEAPAARGIFDLQGRRLKSATAPGLYIIDGRKVLVK